MSEYPAPASGPPYQRRRDRRALRRPEPAPGTDGVVASGAGIEDAYGHHVDPVADDQVTFNQVAFHPVAFDPVAFDPAPGAYGAAPAEVLDQGYAQQYGTYEDPQPQYAYPWPTVEPDAHTGYAPTGNAQTGDEEVLYDAYGSYSLREDERAAYQADFRRTVQRGQNGPDQPGQPDRADSPVAGAGYEEDPGDFEDFDEDDFGEDFGDGEFEEFDALDDEPEDDLEDDLQDEPDPVRATGYDPGLQTGRRSTAQQAYALNGMSDDIARSAPAASLQPVRSSRSSSPDHRFQPTQTAAPVASSPAGNPGEIPATTAKRPRAWTPPPANRPTFSATQTPFTGPIPTQRQAPRPSLTPPPTPARKAAPKPGRTPFGGTQLRRQAQRRPMVAARGFVPSQDRVDTAREVMTYLARRPWLQLDVVDIILGTQFDRDDVAHALIVLQQAGRIRSHLRGDRVCYSYVAT
ncbi:hypothetical protein [Kineosporia sp. NBRC 101731]|uniref:hypothetical protein n=1 Tax=Kineosporia sp. NBRC 101731 TaxID=3032199 RepID=UPI0024A604BE|nr:hypothetical protein [Kineosporia sp. NBRC 101731]GLY33154.1 hypothetical protein Kisp02_65190 [Kineosporia sp. NBRC 101731]